MNTTKSKPTQNRGASIERSTLQAHLKRVRKPLRGCGDPFRQGWRWGYNAALTHISKWVTGRPARNAKRTGGLGRK